MIDSRAELERSVGELEERLAGQDIPLPPHWGGYLSTPHAVEFWQHRESRRHDRLVYRRAADGTWRIDRLAP